MVGISLSISVSDSVSRLAFGRSESQRVKVVGEQGYYIHLFACTGIGGYVLKRRLGVLLRFCGAGRLCTLESR